MDDAPVVAEATPGGGNLQGAPRVARRDDVGGEGGDVPGLALTKLSCRLWLHEVVDPGTAAADVGLGWCHQLDARNGGEQIAWLASDALRMQEVTRIVVRDARLDRMPGCSGIAQFDQHF